MSYKVIHITLLSFIISSIGILATSEQLREASKQRIARQANGVQSSHNHLSPMPQFGGFSSFKDWKKEQEKKAAIDNMVNTKERLDQETLRFEKLIDKLNRKADEQPKAQSVSKEVFFTSKNFLIGFNFIMVAILTYQRIRKSKEG